MKTFLVGGAIRDTLLGLEPKDKDFVVVGSSVKGMLSLGFTQVGKDFPVFLHPETGDEHALARKEISTGVSHTDFDCDIDGVTLEEDLMRRDLTINSMAMGEDGTIIDPFGGQKDLEDKVLRATSDAFKEDPLRVLRVARFLARFGDEWTVEQETLETMVDLFPQVREISPERIWKEAERALMEDSPWLFLGILGDVMGIRVGRGHQATIISTQKKAVKASLPAEARWAIFLTRLHPTEAVMLNELLKVPTSFGRLYTHAMRNYNFNGKMTAEDCLGVLLKLNGLHDDSHLPRVMSVLACLLHHRDMSHMVDMWSNISGAARSVESKPFIDLGFTGKELGDKIKEERINRIRGVLDED